MSIAGSWDDARPTSSPSLQAARRLAVLLDAGIRIPGTRFSFGLDPIIGLIPGFGDAAGAVLACWIFVTAIRLGASRATLLRIAANVALDAGVGAIPVIGDMFDFVWKANLRNVALLERHLAAPATAARADRWFILLVSCGVLVMVLALLALGILLTRWVFHALAGA